MAEKRDRVLNYDGLKHLIDRLDARYWDGLAYGLTPEEVDDLLEGEEIPEEATGIPGTIPDAAYMNTAGVKKDRVLNYPGLAHLIGRLDARYLRQGSSASMAEKLAHARTISVTGEASGAAAFDGTQDISIVTSVQRLTNTELEAMLT